jgi:lantibiotic modifying enzyme
MPIKVSALIIALLLPVSLSLAADRVYRDQAIKTASWIEASAVKTPQGNAWPTDPLDAKTLSTNLYGGVSGIVLFFLEAYRSTGNSLYLDDVRRGADYLVAALPDEKETGLYEGVAGIGFALNEVFKATRDEKYRTQALKCVQTIKDKTIRSGKGIEWSAVTDIIGGSAGTGLFLLYAARELKDPAARELAVQAGERLIELGKREAGGLKWAMDPTFKRLMPNFSHGTAGICYFLATLYKETRKKEFLDASLAGARYLQSIAATEGNACFIFHDEPDNKTLYYLGWCHGPVGTTRLFYRLYEVTGDKQWMDWVKKLARGLLDSGIPEKPTPGFWNNVGQCCGSAGVGEFFLSLYRVTHDSEYLSFSKRVTANLLTRSTEDKNGLKWIQAEHRIKPELLVAQTGYMQGAAGIGMWLIHLDDFEQGKKSKLTFPDNPF